MLVPDTRKLVELGERLQRKRLKRNETQRLFAARLAVSVPTLRKMEAGDPAIQIGHWVMALYILDHLEDLDTVLKDETNLFELYEIRMKQARKRASKTAKQPILSF